MKSVSSLLNEIKSCTLCSEVLSHGPNPVVQFTRNSKLLIIGQAPGLKVHHSGIPWNDASGKRLREWLQMDSSTFYNPDIVGIVPMGFCYPGKGKSGDLPPRPECAKKWHSRILNQLPEVELILLIGAYAQKYYLKEECSSLTECVQNFHKFLPQYLPLPHPSPRNQFWLKKNPWFESQLLPVLRSTIQSLNL